MTATLPPLGPTADTWGHAEVVDLIAADPEWPEHLPARWRAIVAPAAHRQSHGVRPIPGCPGCEQVGTCEWCTRPMSECPDPSDHYRQARGSDESLLKVGAAMYGRGGVR